MEFVIMIGLSSSGKTTYCKKHYHDYEHISLDKIKNHSRLEESRLIEEKLMNSNNIVVDDTNLSKKIRSQHVMLAKKYASRITAVYLQTSIGLIKQRNWRRHSPLPDKAINKMVSQLEIPTEDEGFDKLMIIKQ